MFFKNKRIYYNIYSSYYLIKIYFPSTRLLVDSNWPVKQPSWYISSSIIIDNNNRDNWHGDIKKKSRPLIFNHIFKARNIYRVTSDLS